MSRQATGPNPKAILLVSLACLLATALCATSSNKWRLVSLQTGVMTPVAQWPAALETVCLSEARSKVAAAPGVAGDTPPAVKWDGVTRTCTGLALENLNGRVAGSEEVFMPDDELQGGEGAHRRLSDQKSN